MAIVTLTSDLGTKDHYVAMLKGKLLSKSAAIHVVDISHEIRSFNIQQAAFILRNAFSFFPKNTIHLASVQSDQKPSLRCVLIKYKDYFFAGVDNGLFSLVFDEEPEEIIEIGLADKSIFVVRDILCDAVGELANGKIITSLGKKIPNLESRTFLKAPESNEFINGEIGRAHV